LLAPRISRPVMASRALFITGPPPPRKAAKSLVPAAIPSYLWKVSQRGDNHEHRHRSAPARRAGQDHRSEEHTSELQSLMRISYDVFCLKHNKKTHTQNT